MATISTPFCGFHCAVAGSGRKPTASTAAERRNELKYLNLFTISVSTYTGTLNHLRPFFDIGADDRAVLLRRVAHHFRSLTREAVLHVGVLQDLDDALVQPRD